MSFIFQELQHALQIMATNGYLPESLKYGFVSNAVLCALLIGPILGSIGTIVVAKRLAFFSAAIGNAALTGVAIGILLGESFASPYISLFAFCLIFSLLLHYVKNRTKLSNDTLIGVFLSISMAIGASLLLYVTKKINLHVLDSILFGSILTVDSTDITLLFVMFLVTVIFLYIGYKSLMLSSFSPMLAQVRGVNVTLYDYLFIILVTLITAASVKIVGAVLVEALLLIPAATARNMTKSMKVFIILSILIASISSIGGVLIPVIYEIQIPTGGAIIILASLFFIFSLLYAKIRHVIFKV